MRVLIAYMWKVGLPNMHIAEVDVLLQLLLPAHQPFLFVGKGSPFKLWIITMKHLLATTQVNNEGLTLGSTQCRNCTDVLCRASVIIVSTFQSSRFHTNAWTSYPQQNQAKIYENEIVHLAAILSSTEKESNFIEKERVHKCGAYAAINVQRMPHRHIMNLFHYFSVTHPFQLVIP